MPLPGEFPWREFLDQNPEATFEQSLGGLGKEKKRFFQDRFSRMQRQYLGSLANFAINNPGETPTQHFSDYLKNVDWQDEFFNDPNRLENAGRFPGRTKFLYNQ